MTASGENASSAGKGSSKPRLKTVALPASYGSWSLVSEPILLGLFVAPSWSGLLIALAGLFAFLSNQPLKIILADRQRGRHYARTQLAQRIALIYFILAAALFLVTFWQVGLWLLLPVGLAVPLLIIFVVYDNRPGRSWQAELAAPAAFSAVAAGIAIAAGWSIFPALALWLIMIARSLPAVLYVRARLRLAKGKQINAIPAIATHMLALVLIIVLTAWRLVPASAVLAFLILLLRAAVGLSRYRRDIQPMTLGWIETATGLFTVLLIAIGYWLG
jgi:hypothetical protein